MSQNSQDSIGSVTARLLRRRSSVSSNSSSIHSNSTISDSAAFSQRIVSVDCYTAFPIPQLDPLISEFRGAEVKRVPVIRIYGATPRGQKTCTNIHGVFPYIYVEDSPDDDLEYTLPLALDKAINALFNQSGTKPNDKSSQQHVFKICRVKGRSFYGYKSHDKEFLQIFFYSPISFKKGVELLESGRILGQRFQPYEAHIPYILQFFLDYKLYGMNFVHFREVKFRRTDTTSASSQLLTRTPTTTGCGSKTYWDLETMPEELLLPPKVTPRCRLELEIDVKASNILVSSSTQGKNPGIVDIWLDEKERRRYHSMTNWANITIPQSPARTNETDFIFPRESELLQTLGDFLSGDKDVSSLMDQAQSSQSQADSQGFASFSSPVDSPASQLSDARRSLISLSQRISQQSDGYIVGLLEDIADEESDSILQCSQSRQSTPSASSLAVENQRDEFPDDEEDLVEDEWADDFLSQRTMDMLEKWEQEMNNEREGYLNSYDEVHQCDGQHDHSDDEIEIDDTVRVTRSSPLRRTRNPLPRSRRSSGKEVSTAKTLSQIQFKNKVLNQIKVAEVAIESDGSDSDCKVVSVVDKKSPQKAELSSKSKRLRAISIEVIESDSESKPSKREKASNASNGPCQESYLSTVKTSSPEKLRNDKGVSDDRDSGITSFLDVPGPEDNPTKNGKGSDSDSSQEILPASPVKSISKWSKMKKNRNEATTGRTGIDTASVKSPKSPAASADDSLMTSIYNYGDESFFNDDSPSQSQPESVVSVYEYSNQNSDNDKKFDLTQTQDANKSFQDIMIDFSAPLQSSEAEGHELSQLSENEEAMEDSAENENGMTEFQRQQIRLRMIRKVQREEILAARSMLRPSIFPLEIHPLKQTPSVSDVEKWCMESAKNMASHSAENEPISLKYIRDAPGGDAARTKLIGDVIRLSRAIEKIKNRRKIQAPSLQIDEFEKPFPDAYEPNVIHNSETRQTRESNQTSNLSSDSDDSDDEGPQQLVRAFRFRGAGEKSDSGSSGEDADDDDNDTIIGSPASSSFSQALSPAVSSQDSNGNSNPILSTTTPKSILVDKAKRRPSLEMRKKRLDFCLNLDGHGDSPESNKICKDSQEWPKFHPEDSELDTLNASITPKSTSELNSSNLKHAKASHEHQFLTTFAVEVHCAARRDLVPDPEFDSVAAIFYAIHHDCPDNTSVDCLITGLLYVDSSAPVNTISSEEIFPSEISMFQRFVELVKSYDPDILVGYEIEKFSWGYLIQRGSYLGLNMLSELSRILPLPHTEKNQNAHDCNQWNETVNGRIVFNLWKLLRHELAVTSYTYENMVLQILHQKVHRLAYIVLHNYWQTPEKRSNVKEYFKTRVVNWMRIIDKLDLINRTSELARLFGIQFFEVLSRGSQFRVESMMLRLTKPVGLIPPSPNPMQRARMKAPEYLPLILEPESKFYTDPVAVLDFQSLYPSMMIAYNYCFSTCIGRLEHFTEDSFDMGCLQQEINRSEIARLYRKGLIHISPCRVVFVKSSVKKGILSTMLEQILDTRQMVKRSMKKWKDNETLQKVLDSRQLGLKLIANVTYGYTSANWSGRMPCVEIADSIVSKGRETLQRAIDHVKDNEHVLGGKVIYGDTDSLFVLFPGKTRQEAFVLAQQIVDDVTQANPKPVKLKLEKVYQPCILQTKKRYVGFAYEAPDQKEPKYDAKGIETVRRDGCPATAKILEGAIRVLFTKQDEASVKLYVTEQFRKIFLGRVSLSNYTFARKFRGRQGYKPGARVPSLEIAKKLGEKDRRSEPLPKERVPYIVTYGNPWAPLIERVRRPEEFINDLNLRLNAHYYIEKAIIPALNRCLNLAGFHADKWLLTMPRKYLKSDYAEGASNQKKGTIDQYFVSQKCIKCESRAASGFCESCFKTPGSLRDFLVKQTRHLSVRYEGCLTTCQDCSKENDMICINMDCPVKHKFLRYERDYRAKLPKLKELQNRLALLEW